jgi:hypothetical protein
VLRVTEADARVLARIAGASDQERRIADRMKGLERYSALFFGEGRSRAATVLLRSGRNCAVLNPTAFVVWSRVAPVSTLVI